MPNNTKHDFAYYMECLQHYLDDQKVELEAQKELVTKQGDLIRLQNHIIDQLSLVYYQYKVGHKSYSEFCDKAFDLGETAYELFGAPNTTKTV